MLDDRMDMEMPNNHTQMDMMMHDIKKIKESLKGEHSMPNASFDVASTGFGGGAFGGMGGWGGGWGGIAPVGLFGLIGGRRGFGGDDCCDGIGEKLILNKLHDNARDIWETRADTAKDIGEAKFGLCERVGSAEAALGRDICDTKTHLSQVIACEGRHTDGRFFSLQDKMCANHSQMQEKICELGHQFECKIDGVHKHIAQVDRALTDKFCELRNEQKDMRIRELELKILRQECNEDTRKNNDSVTQIIGSTITTTLTSLLSGNKAG